MGAIALAIARRRPHLPTKLLIIGLPTSGNTTAFNAVTKVEAATGTFGASGDEPNLATVTVCDPRLDRLAEMFNPKANIHADALVHSLGDERLPWIIRRDETV
jgi:hypothetical protein